MGRALVLNVTEAPLAVVAARRAVVLVLKDKADVVVSNGAIFRSERVALEAPSVVRLRSFVHVPYRAHAPLTRRAVFARDRGLCQYCGAPAENLDHVDPALARRAPRVGERGRGVSSLQRQEDGPHARPRPATTSRRAPYAPSDGFRLTLGQLEPGWERYLSA